MLFLLGYPLSVGKSIIANEIWKKSAAENGFDWIRDVSDQYIGAFVVFVNRMSTYIKQNAKKYGFRDIEMDKELFGNVTKEVMKSLELNAD